jgi:hypothetical protein
MSKMNKEERIEELENSISLTILELKALELKLKNEKDIEERRKIKELIRTDNQILLEFQNELNQLLN